jgi:hypothetical protein
MEPSSQNAPSSNWKELQEQFRERPLQSALIAFLAGLLLSLAPVRNLIGLAFRLALFALKPALLILGSLKLYEYFTQQSLSPEEKH